MLNVPPQYRDLPRWAFGDGPALADELLALVLAGKKTATCGALWQYEQENWPITKVGEREIILDGRGNPRCLIEATEVAIKPFDEVDAQFAYDEGEDDRSYEAWRREHEKYFRRQGRSSPGMQVVCLRFRLVEVFPGEGHK